MSDYDSENSEISNDDYNDYEKKKTINRKQRKPYEYTDARKQAFARMLEIKKLKQQNKNQKKNEEKQIKKEVIKKTKEKIKKLPIDKLKIIEEEDEIIEPVRIKKHKPKKEKIDYISESSTSESDYQTDSDYSEKKIIKYNNRKVMIKPVKKKEKIYPKEEIEYVKPKIKPKSIPKQEEYESEEEKPVRPNRFKRDEPKYEQPPQKKQPMIIFA